MVGRDGREYEKEAPCSAGRQCRSTQSTILCCESSSQLRKWSCCAVVSSVLSSAGICVLVVGYTVLGAVTFMALEGTNPKDSPSSSTSPSAPTLGLTPADDRLRSQTVEKLWSITEDLNILYKENWTRLAEQEVLKFQDVLVRKYRTGAPANINSHNHNHNHNHLWTFSSSFLYSLTLITTIGYGSVSPRTPWGRIMTIIYAMIGIPLMLVYLSTVGDSLAKNFRRLYGRMNRADSDSDSCSGSKSKRDREAAADFVKTALDNHFVPSTTAANQQEKFADCKINTNKDSSSKMKKLCSLADGDLDGDSMVRQRVPILLTLSVVVGYISGGAFLFNRLENWTLLEGSYFCFTSLGTIGFGELIPGSGASATMSADSRYKTGKMSEQVSVFVSSAYILVGMAVIAMCFNLVQDETVSLVRTVTFWMSKQNKPGGEGRGRGEENDGRAMIPMSVVSS